MCNFASMKQTIEDYIRHDDKFRQALLKLGGGILKYWAEHPEDDFDIDLFNGYEKQVVEAYLQANRRNRALRLLPDDKLKWDALSWYHHESGKELKFYTDLRPELNKLPKEVKEQVDGYFVDYLEDNYREYLRYAYPANIAPIDFYNKVIRTFGVGGLARDCMDYILKDHHHPEVWSKMKSVDVVMTEFYIEEYSAFLSEERCFKKLRQGVKEKLAGKNQTECRHEAVKMMNSVKGFARMLYSSSEIGITDCTGGYKVDKKWLRGQSEGLAVAFRRDGYLKNSFPEYVGILNDIGRIWAARLLKEHGIDMHELEKEAGAILYPVTEPTQNPDGLDNGNYKYYVDKDIFDPLDDQCCIYDEVQAKELLDAVKNRQSSEKEEYPQISIPDPKAHERTITTRELRTKFWFDFNNQAVARLTTTMPTERGKINDTDRHQEQMDIKGLQETPPPIASDSIVLPEVFQDVLNSNEIAKKLLHIKHAGLGSKQFAQVVEEFFREIGWAADVCSTKFVEWMKGKGIIRTTNTSASRNTKTKKAEEERKRKAGELKENLRDTFQHKNGANIWEDRAEFYKRKDALKINNGKPNSK